jgi:hypothetical protein
MIAYCKVIEAAGGKVHVDPFEACAFEKHLSLSFQKSKLTW